MLRTTFIGVTGSCGKTTTTALLGAILAKAGPTNIGLINNTEPAIKLTLLKTRPWHRWCVQELSATGPGTLDARVGLARPRVGIVTMIGTDHYQRFRDRDSIATEKGKLIERLPRNGLAILNADDPRVAAMRARTRARVITFGRTTDADLRAFDVSSDWPGRLRFKVEWRGQVTTVQTQLVGAFWVTAILAAMSCALTLGVDMATVVAAIGRFEPVFGRNSVHAVPGGPIFICGTIKAPHGSMQDDLAVLAHARAPRKTLVLGNISDYAGSGTPKYRTAARLAIAGGARVIAVGRNARTIRHIIGDHAPGSVRTFDTTKEVHDFLIDDAIPDELILLKAAASSHVERIVLNWGQDHRCFIEDCGLKYCDLCPYLVNAMPLTPGQSGRVPALVIEPQLTPGAVGVAAHR